MLENQKFRPHQVIGPLGEPLTLESLPKPGTTRWVVRRKAEVVAAVGDRAELEATGGLTLEAAGRYAATGVDFLSVGALTHSSPILDIALDLRTR